MTDLPITNSRSDAEKIFMKAFRGDTKGAMGRAVARRIRLGLNALVEAELLRLEKPKRIRSRYCDLPGRGY